jgi:ankyrin repeat protein
MKDDFSPLLLSSQDSDFIRVSQHLVEHGADMNWTNKQGYTPLAFSVINNN